MQTFGEFDRASLQAPGCDELKPVCNVFEEMNKMEEIKSHQEHYGMKRPPPKKRAENKETFKRQKVPRGTYTCIANCHL